MLISHKVVCLWTELISNITHGPEIITLFLHHEKLSASFPLLFLEQLVILLEFTDSLALIHLDLKIVVFHQLVNFVHDFF